MKKTLKIISSIMAIAVFALFISCEGPEGPAGPAGADGTNGVDGVDGVDGTNGTDGVDGTDGTDGTATCMACHNDGTSFSLKQVEFAESDHAMGTYYTRGGECSGCHSTEGFLARQDFASASEIFDLSVGDQSPISCRTCHMVHENYDETDWGLTFDDVVSETIFGLRSPEHDSYSFNDMGNSNMCMQCHQSRDRGNVPSTTSTDSVSTNSHWGPHYGVQGNILHAKAGVHIAGSVSYPSTGNGHANLSSACITCHMHEGDHRLEVNYNACTGCHDDGEALVEDLHDEIKALMFEVGAALTAQGVMRENTDETGAVTGYSPAGGTVSAAQAAALWNYMVAYQDHSYGTHNPSYIKALLTNTKESLAK